MGNHWTSQAEASRFRQANIVSIILPRGFATLTDRHYRRRVAQEETSATITDPRVYRMRMSLMFGIDLSPDETARPPCESDNATERGIYSPLCRAVRDGMLPPQKVSVQACEPRIPSGCRTLPFS